MAPLSFCALVESRTWIYLPKWEFVFFIAERLLLWPAATEIFRGSIVALSFFKSGRPVDALDVEKGDSLTH